MLRSTLAVSICHETKGDCTYDTQESYQERSILAKIGFVVCDVRKRALQKDYNCHVEKNGDVLESKCPSPYAICRRTDERTWEKLQS